MDQTLYYVFSTTAQVLAAMLVFYGLFFLERMRIFRKKFTVLTENFLMEIDEKDEKKKEVIAKVKPVFEVKGEWNRLYYRINSSLRQGNYTWIITNIKKAIDGDSENDILKQTENGMNRVFSMRKSFAENSKITVVLGFAHLILSMLILSIVSIFDNLCCKCFSYCLLTINFLSLAGFIYFIAQVIINVFKEEIENDSK